MYFVVVCEDSGQRRDHEVSRSPTSSLCIICYKPAHRSKLFPMLPCPPLRHSLCWPHLRSLHCSTSTRLPARPHLLPVVVALVRTPLKPTQSAQRRSLCHPDALSLEAWSSMLMPYRMSHDSHLPGLR